MNKIKKVSIVALVLLLVGAVGSILTFKPMIQQKSISKEKVINEKFNHIKMVTDNTGVEILPTTDSTARVSLTGKIGKGSKYHLSTDAENATLSVRVKYEQRSFINFFPSSLSLKVYVPKTVYESLRIEGDNGRISLSDLQAKDINVKTDNGKIEFDNVKGTTITTQTDNGLSNLKNVKASFVKANSDNGRIALENVEGRIFAKANNGRISLVTHQLDQPIKFETDNGRINIQTKKKPTNAIINASTENGRVELFDRSNRNAVFGNGEHLIKLTASNGRITVENK
ncbi:DUF4097 family beta strand repeat-containing protein [Heyndrickxia acidiproducens]|uniref:DUF4097 family beta strand repeat-containing protein n=1 Tax=Heyndrickxia acidiproducens TaxID=1121084 RepID=UPI00036307D9|nr:DUF4097 family beta strand repeat-containing protein [Heyndrickxia acidiproducens]